MNTTYKITQQVKIVNKVYYETVFESGVKRVALFFYDQLCEDNPNEYFELIEVKHEESCLKYSNKYQNKMFESGSNLSPELSPQNENHH